MAKFSPFPVASDKVYIATIVFSCRDRGFITTMRCVFGSV